MKKERSSGQARAGEQPLAGHQREKSRSSANNLPELGSGFFSRLSREPPGLVDTWLSACEATGALTTDLQPVSEDLRAVYANHAACAGL